MSDDGNRDDERKAPTGTVEAMATAIQHARAHPVDHALLYYSETEYRPHASDHPAPWTWNWRQDRGDAQPHPAGWVTDANGRTVLSGAEPGSPLAREMIRLAPALEALLRKAQREIVEHLAKAAFKQRPAPVELGYYDQTIEEQDATRRREASWLDEERARASATGLPKQIASLLAALDAARKATP